nr:Arm DNA-binding domain-containing protein [Thalassovita autumnalis]
MRHLEGTHTVLSDARIRALKPKEKPYKQTDFDGLYLLIKPNGSKLWRVKYAGCGKRSCWRWANTRK